jgi:hypothetical protein
LAGYINISGAWKRVKEAYIKTAEWFDPTTLTIVPEQWKKAKEIWLNVGDNIWEKVFPTVITPVTESQVELTSSTAAASGRTILTGKYYHWIDGDTITYYFEKTDSATPTFSSISSAVVVNPNTGTSSTVSYIVPQSDVTLPTLTYPNMANEYRFHVNAVNAETGGTGDSYNTSATNVFIYPPRDITNLSASGSSTSTISVSWTEGFYTESFRVEYKQSSSSTYIIWDHYDNNPGLNFAIISGLTQGITYDIKVTPYSGLRVDSTSSKGYYGNSSTTSATTLIAPGNVTNGLVFLNPTYTLGATANVSQIEGYGNANYVIVTVNVEDFVKDNSSITIAGATGSQSVLNGSWLTVSHPDRSKFYIYNASGGWASIGTQTYSSGCTARYRDRTTPYNATLFWTPGSNTTGYELVLYEATTPSFQTITLGATNGYSFTSVGGVPITKNQFFTVSITPYNGSIAGNTYYFYSLGARSNTSGDVAFNTESAINTVSASFVKVSGFGTSASPWQGDVYALTPGTWIYNGDGSANIKVYLRDWAVDTGADYLVYDGFAVAGVSSRPVSTPSWFNYQIPNNSVFGSPLYMAAIFANDSTLDAVFPGDQGLGTYSFATTGNVNRLRGPGAGTGEVTANKTTTSLLFYIYQNTPNPPNWYYFFYRYTPAVTGGNGVYTLTTVGNNTFSSASNPAVLGFSGITSASWYVVYFYGYNNGVFSQEVTSIQTYTKATALPSTPTTSEFYMERSGNTLYWWKIADNYTNVHLIWIRIDRYVGGVYQNSYNYYFYPYFFTVTSNLAGYPSNPSTSVRYSIDISSLPSGTYYPFLGFYNYDFGFGPGPVQTNYVGTTYPFTK